MNWRDFENQAFDWFCSNYDPDAELRGGSSSIESDIWSPLHKCYVEVKKLPAQCGQFTLTTINNNPISNFIYDMLINGSTINIEKIKEWIFYHYSQKRVKMFIVGPLLKLLTLEEFLSVLNFSVIIRNKKSGTRPTPHKDISMLLENFSFLSLCGNTLVCTDKSKEATYIDYKNNQYFIQADTCEIRKCSKTSNSTIIFSVKGGVE